MKELYSFDVKRTVEKEVPHVKKTKNGPVETTKKVKNTAINETWRFGTFRADVNPDGRR